MEQTWQWLWQATRREIEMTLAQDKGDRVFQTGNDKTTPGQDTASLQCDNKDLV